MGRAGVAAAAGRAAVKSRLMAAWTESSCAAAGVAKMPGGVVVSVEDWEGAACAVEYWPEEEDEAGWLPDAMTLATAEPTAWALNMCVEGWSWPEAAIEVWRAASEAVGAAASMMPAAAARWATAELANSDALEARALAVAVRCSACMV